MAFGDRREAVDLGDPDAILARFEPAAGRTARLVLHPRLTFIPCDPDAFEGLRGSFAVAVPVRMCTAVDLAAAGDDGASHGERAAAYDAAIEQVLTARARRDSAVARAETSERKLRDARARFDRVALQRAQADDAIAAARERLALLQGGDGNEAELRRALEAARHDAALAADELTRAIADATTGGGVPEAERALAEAEFEVQRIDYQGERVSEHPVDTAAHNLELWAAQRVVESARFELQRARAYRESDAARTVVDDAQRRLDTARARVGAAESALEQRATGAGAVDAPAEAAAIRAQIEAVQRSLSEAAEARGLEVLDAERDADAARRDVAATERALSALVERVDPGGDRRDLEAVAERLRCRRSELDVTDSVSPTLRALRRLAEEAAEPLIVLVEPFPEPPADLVEALVAISGLKRVAIVTDKTEVLHRARDLDPAIGAVRQPLDTGGAPRQELARSDGNRS